MRTVAGIALLLLVGLLLGASMLVYAAYVSLAVFWISRYLSRRWTEALRGTRTMSASEVEIGEVVQVQLKLDNRDSLPVLWVLFEDVLPRRALFGPPPALELEGSNLRICSVSSGSSRIVTYKLRTLRRGYFQVGPTLVETGDLLGLHRRFRRLTDADFILVLPRIVPLTGYDVASKRPVGEVNVTYRLLEDPTMIAGIRQYQHGDPLRSIHWRATARTGQLQCKQYQPTSVAGAMLVVDLHTRSNPRHYEPVRSDLAVTAAASVAHTLLQLQQQFGLISNGRDVADRVVEKSSTSEYRSLEEAQRSVAMLNKSDRLRPIVIPIGRGPEHFVHLHRTLARLERSDGMTLEELLFESQSRLPRDASVIVILQQVDDTAALALGMLRRQGYSVSAIVNNYDNEAFTSAVGRLLAQQITVFHLLDEESIPQICKEMVLRY